MLRSWADWWRRWRERRRLLRKAAELEAVARRRCASPAAVLFSITAIAAAAAGTTSVRDFASGEAQRYRVETAAIRAKAQSMREEAKRLAGGG